MQTTTGPDFLALPLSAVKQRSAGMDIEKRYFDGRGLGSCLVHDDYGREWRIVVGEPGTFTTQSADLSVEVAGHIVVSAGSGSQTDEMLGSALRYIRSHPAPAE